MQTREQVDADRMDAGDFVEPHAQTSEISGSSEPRVEDEDKHTRFADAFIRDGHVKVAIDVASGSKGKAAPSHDDEICATHRHGLLALVSRRSLRDGKPSGRIIMVLSASVKY